MKQLEQVREFHVAMGIPVAQKPAVPPYDRLRLRASLIMEEALETCGALIGIPKEHTKAFIAANNAAIQAELDPQCDIVETADGLCDLVYVCLGASLELGLPFAELFDEVHRSNMQKKDGPIRADGKRGKPEGWQPPELGNILDLYA